MLTPVRGYPDKIKIYQMAASPFWQVRCYDSGKSIRRSTGATDKRDAFKFAKSLYEKINYDKRNGVAVRKTTRFDVCAKKMLEMQANRVALNDCTKMSHDNDIYLLDGKILPVFRDKDIAEIDHQSLKDFVAHICGDLKPSSIQRHFAIIRKVFDHASDRNLLKTLPKNQNKDEPRGWFTGREYATLLVRANKLVGTERAIRLAQKGAQVQGNLVCNLKFTADLPKMIELMVNSYIRPTDLKNMRYHHVEIVHNTHTFMRLSLPESKKHDKPIATQAKAVALNEEFYATHSVDGLASEQDYVLMPEFPNRDMALQLLQHQFNELLDDLGFKTGPRGEARTIYSLRHTCIMYALKHHTAEHVTIAKNARTSGEMNIAAIQGTQQKEMAFGSFGSLGQEQKFKPKQYLRPTTYACLRIASRRRCYEYYFFNSKVVHPSAKIATLRLGPSGRRVYVRNYGRPENCRRSQFEKQAQ